MYHRSKDEFISAVLNEVKFSFDHKKIREELENHLNDQIEDLCLEGMSEDEAEAHAVQLMGDAIEIGQDLNEVHKPLWGRLLIVSKMFFVIVMLSLSIQLVFPKLQDVYLKMTHDHALKATLESLSPEISLSKSANVGFRFEQGNYVYTVKEMAYDKDGNLAIRIETKYRNFLKKGDKLNFGSRIEILNNDDLSEKLSWLIITGIPYTYAYDQYMILDTQDVKAVRFQLGSEYEIIEVEAAHETE